VAENDQVCAGLAAEVLVREVVHLDLTLRGAILARAPTLSK
jgi:hypothetical protein